MTAFLFAEGCGGTDAPETRFGREWVETSEINQQLAAPVELNKSFPSPYRIQPPSGWKLSFDHSENGNFLVDTYGWGGGKRENGSVPALVITVMKGQGSPDDPPVEEFLKFSLSKTQRKHDEFKQSEILIQRIDSLTFMRVDWHGFYRRDRRFQAGWTLLVLVDDYMIDIHYEDDSNYSSVTEPLAIASALSFKANQAASHYNAASHTTPIVCMVAYGDRRIGGSSNLPQFFKLICPRKDLFNSMRE